MFNIGTKKFKEFISFLKYALNQPLPGRTAQSLMMPVIHESDLQYFNNELKLRPAAVMIILFPEDNKIKTVFIKRMPDPGPHSGQIAFPGGRKEITDIDLTDTAIREVREEIGVNISPEKIIGKLTPIEIPVSGFSVLPVISVLDNKPDFVLCEKEVGDIYVIDIIELFNNKDFRTVPARGIQIETPCYLFNGTIIWGATAMVLSEFETLIFNQ